ncbi:MAG: HEAT repeat domain-containing protein [Candidatus Hodarchaeota archaeon]
MKVRQEVKLDDLKDAVKILKESGSATFLLNLLSVFEELILSYGKKLRNFANRGVFKDKAEKQVWNQLLCARGLLEEIVTISEETAFLSLKTLENLLRSREFMVYDTASESLCVALKKYPGIGGEVMGVLRRLFLDKDPKVGEAAVNTLRKVARINLELPCKLLPELRYLSLGDREMRMRAMDALDVFVETNAEFFEEETISILKEIVFDDNEVVVDYACYIMNELVNSLPNRIAVLFPIIRRMIESEKAHVRLKAYSCLIEIISNVSEDVLKDVFLWMQELARDKERFCKETVVALSILVKNFPEFVGGVLRLLKDFLKSGDREIRVAIADSLVDMVSVDFMALKEAVEILKCLLRDMDFEVRKSAFETLYKVVEQGARHSQDIAIQIVLMLEELIVEDVLFSFRKWEHWEIKEKLAFILKTLIYNNPQVSEKALPLMINFLGEDDPEVQKHVVFALEKALEYNLEIGEIVLPEVRKLVETAVEGFKKDPSSNEAFTYLVRSCSALEIVLEKLGKSMDPKTLEENRKFLESVDKLLKNTML